MTHHCHWPGCRKAVPPKLWGCRNHWYALPAPLRAAIWRTYVPGQEVTKTPNREYVAAAHAVQDWAGEQDAKKAAAREVPSTSSVIQSLPAQPTLNWDEAPSDGEPR